jgi:hypothetical protein
MIFDYYDYAGPINRSRTEFLDRHVHFVGEPVIAPISLPVPELGWQF